MSPGTARTHIVHVTPVLRLGGLLRTLELLDSDGAHKHSVVSVFDADAEEEFSALRYVRRLRLPFQALSNLEQQVKAICHTALELRADVLHSHHFFVDVGVALAAGRMRLPCVRTVHGVTQRVQSNPFQPTVVRDDWSRPEVDEQRVLQELGVRSVAVSHSLRDKLVGHGFDPAKLTVVRPGVADVSSARSNSQPGAVQIAYPHRLEAVKNPSLMLETVAELARRGLACKVLVPATGELLARTEVLTAKMALNQHVQFLPATTDIWERIGRVDLFLMTSGSEGLPFTVLEAMARGLPVVATRVGGVGEAVRTGTTGLLCTQDHRQLADAVQRLANDPDLRARMGDAGQEIVRREFSINSHLAAISDVYDKAEVLSG